MKPYIQVGAVIRDGGSAIVTVVHGEDEDCVVTGIESLAFDPEELSARVVDLGETEPPETQFVIDGDGLGNALWTIIGPDPGPRDKHRFRLYGERGIARQELIDGLVVAIARDGLHFKARIPAQEAMNKALQSYKRTVREDGEVGTELVVALCLAVLPRPKPIRHLAFLA